MASRRIRDLENMESGGPREFESGQGEKRSLRNYGNRFVNIGARCRVKPAYEGRFCGWEPR